MIHMLKLNVALLCTVFSSPEFYMSKDRKDTVCDNLPAIIENAEVNNLDPFLLMGLITTESRWNKSVVSSSGACGLTQVIPRFTGGKSTDGKKYSCEDLLAPQTSIYVGAKILKWWISEYGDGDINVGLCGYNAGFRCKGPEKSTKGLRYSERVKKFKAKIERHYDQLENE